MACKPWPDDPAQTVIAMAYLDPGDTAVEGERHPHLLLAKADSRSGRLLERYDSDFEEDASVAVGSDSLWLDTARYRLSPTVRAFGVVFHSVARGASCPEAGFDNLLTLVVPAGEGKLRPVLNTYLDQWRTLKGSVCSAEPGFEQEVSHLTLELGRGRSNGFADLVITSRVSDGETENGKPLRTVKRTLRYDGERYPFEEYSDFWHRQWGDRGQQPRRNSGTARPPQGTDAPGELSSRWFPRSLRRAPAPAPARLRRPARRPTGNTGSGPAARSPCHCRRATVRRRNRWWPR